MSLLDLCTDIAQMASKEPPVAVAVFGDIASWFVQSVGRLRRAKQQSDTNLIMAGDNLPWNSMTAAEARELNNVQYLASIPLDVVLYAKAIEKFEEEQESGAKQWEMLKVNYIKDVKRFPGCHATERVCLLAAFGACGIESKKGVGSSIGGGGHCPIEHH